MRDSYDVLIVGSGIAGSPLAMALSRVGLTVAVVERGVHPRFAIGESTVPETTLTYDYLSRTYNIPELRQISHYTGLRSADCTGYPKQLFWFGHHREGAALERRHELMMETFPLPIGPDVHMLREDVDAFLVSRLPAYGVDYFDRTELTDFEVKPEIAVVELKHGGESRSVQAKIVVDASGHGSFFGHRLGMRKEKTELQTRTRAIFGHFEGVEQLDVGLGGRHPDFKYLRQGGTQHHCFDGGWIWGIPFDNNLCSVGALLDPEKFPLRNDLSPEDELMELIRRYPNIERHLGRMKPTRAVIRTPARVQFDSKTILSDRVILTPHAAGFIDPLFSTGIALTNGFIARFVPLAKKAVRQEHIDMELFRPLERAFFAELQHADRIVDSVIRGFRDFEVFKQAWRTWTHGTMLRVTMGIGGRLERSDDAATTLMFGASDQAWVETVKRVHGMLVEGEQRPALELAEDLRAVLDEVSHPFALSKYATQAESACCLGFFDIDFPWALRYLKQNPALAADYSTRRALAFFARIGLRGVTQQVRYWYSALRGKTYHRQIDWIRQIDAARSAANDPPDLRSFS